MTEDDIVREIKKRALPRGYAFSADSEQAMRGLFKLPKLANLDPTNRNRLYDAIMAELDIVYEAELREVKELRKKYEKKDSQISIVLHEYDVPNAAQELSKKLAGPGQLGFSTSSLQPIRDCCPYC